MNDFSLVSFCCCHQITLREILRAEICASLLLADINKNRDDVVTAIHEFIRDNKSNLLKTQWTEDAKKAAAKLAKDTKAKSKK